MKYSTILVISIFVSLLLSCEKKSNVEIKITRFDKDIFALDTNNIAPGVVQLQEKYGEFFDIYTQQILWLRSPDSIRNFLTDKTFRSVYEECLQTYQDVSTIEQKLSNAFGRFQKAFPEKNLPNVYFHVSGFNQAVVTVDSLHILSISIDQYLGEDYLLYKNLVQGDYQLIEMTPEQLPIDAVKAWNMYSYPFNSKSDVLLDNILYLGKIMYALETFMPSEKENVLMAYTKEQLEWCRENEKQMWNQMAEDRHIFLSDATTTGRYIKTAPTTYYFFQSPGRIGIWMGWQIIRSYMKNNKDVSLQTLMLDTDYQGILEKSGYRP